VAVVPPSCAPIEPTGSFAVPVAVVPGSATVRTAVASFAAPAAVVPGSLAPSAATASFAVPVAVVASAAALVAACADASPSRTRHWPVGLTWPGAGAVHGPAVGVAVTVDIGRISAAAWCTTLDGAVTDIVTDVPAVAVVAVWSITQVPSPPSRAVSESWRVWLAPAVGAPPPPRPTAQPHEPLTVDV
jgi:hypothetical protein